MSRFINPFVQHGNDALNPLIDGFLYFFESSTNTPKPTFADVNESIPNAHPVPLSASGREPPIFYTGSANVILTDESGLGQGQIGQADPVESGTSSGGFSTWNGIRIYNIPEIVVGSDLLFYKCTTNGTQGSDPIAQPSDDWEQVKFTIFWNVNSPYIINDIAQGSDGLLYTCVIANTGNDPVTDAVNWKASTTIDVPARVLAAANIFAFNNL